MSGGLNGMARSQMLAPEFATRVLRDVPMSKHTSWHVGGPADLYFIPRDVMDLAAFIRHLPPDVPVLWIGLGSNLLVRDGGVRGVVVSIHGRSASSSARAPRAFAPAPACRARASHGNASNGAWAPLNSSPAFPAPWVARWR